MRSATVHATILQAANTYTGSPNSCYWLGLELINSSTSTAVSTNYGDFYRNGTVVVPTYFSWNPGQPENNAAYTVGSYCRSTNANYNVPRTNVYSNICEYEEELKQPVTDLEQKCVNLTSSFKTLFLNGVCYVLDPATKNYNDAKVSCNTLSGYNGHLAHVRSISELYVAETLRYAAGVTYARIGIEQTNLSSTDPNNGWYLTTPTNRSLLTTYLPWATAPAASMRTIAVTTGYPKSFTAVASTTAYPFICQYDNTPAIATGRAGKSKYFL
uniref:C-type lectin domain-containing protein n=1 Tax=Plectus sambesii TaxID=2011161 RepID=A0A914XPN4_9BILA